MPSAATPQLWAALSTAAARFPPPSPWQALKHVAARERSYRDGLSISNSKYSQGPSGDRSLGWHLAKTNKNHLGLTAFPVGREEGWRRSGRRWIWMDDVGPRGLQATKPGFCGEGDVRGAPQAAGAAAAGEPPTTAGAAA